MICGLGALGIPQGSDATLLCASLTCPPNDDTARLCPPQILEVTPSQGLVVFSDRSQHGSVVIRASGERLHVKGRTAEVGDSSGSVLLGERDQIQLGGVTLALERLTADRLRDEEVEEEAAAVVAGFGGAVHEQNNGGEAVLTGGSGAAAGTLAAGTSEAGTKSGAGGGKGAGSDRDLGVTPP